MTDRLVSSFNPLFGICSGRWGSALPLLLQDESLLMTDVERRRRLQAQRFDLGGLFCVVSSARWRRSTPLASFFTFCWTEEAAVGVGQRYVGGAIEAGGGADGLFGKGNKSERTSDRDGFLQNNPSILPIKPPV